MSAFFPTSIFQQRPLENRAGVVFDSEDSLTLYAEDLENLAGELSAVETELGTDVAGSATDLKTRLAVSINDDGSFKDSLIPVFSGLKIKNGSYYIELAAPALSANKVYTLPANYPVSNAFLKIDSSGNISTDVTAYLSAVSVSSPLSGNGTSGSPLAVDLSSREAVANKSTDTSLGGASPSDTLYPTQKASKTYIDQIIAAANATVYKGVINCSSNPNYPAADAGWLYLISVAGKIGGASGVSVEVGDMVICITDGSASGTQAAVGANWNAIQANKDGVVVGPASSTDGNFVLFDGATGKLIKNSAYSPSSFLPASTVFDYPLALSAGHVSLAYNSTNLKISSNQLNTVQDIATSASPTFANLSVTGDITAGGDIGDDWTDYGDTSTITGWSSLTEKYIRYKKVGNIVFVSFTITGTSNSTSVSFTVPFTSANLPRNRVYGTAADQINNGAALSTVGIVYMAPNTDTIAVVRDGNPATTWTASGTKSVRGCFWFPV